MVNDQVALVPAAGLGVRLKLGPKAFLELGGMSLLKRVAKTLAAVFEHVVFAVPDGYLQQAGAEIGERADVIVGGATRHDTIHRLLDHSTEEIVLIHDIARPFASPDLIQRVLSMGASHGAAGAFLNPVVPAALPNGDTVTTAIPRSRYLLPQAPQAYRRKILLSAFEHARKENRDFQATWDMVIEYGETVYVVAGEETNIKLTTPLDWEIARKVVMPFLDRTDGELR